MPATFTCEWINRLDQFGFVNMDVIVTDDSGIIPTVRASKNWQMSESACDATFLEAQAVILVGKIVEDWNLLNTEV